MREFTEILERVERGDLTAADKLLPLVYDELRRLASQKMTREASGHTLQPTALVHEAWLRLGGSDAPAFENRAHFFGAAAEAMRRILIEHARRKARLKYGGGQHRLDIDDLDIAAVPPDDKLLLVNDALEELERAHPERAKVVVMKFFGGMTNKEVAEALNMGERSVDRHWVFAKIWLYKRLQNVE